MSPPPDGAYALCVAGEASGDQLLSRLELGVPRWGLFGDPIRELTASGTTEALHRLPRIVRAFRELDRATRARPPAFAVLVDFTEANAWLGARLRRRGVPVLWCVCPQVWAWRPGRARALARSMDALATLFAFEPRLFRAHGVDARWVGHPAAEAPYAPSRGGRGVALLPGSRPGEVRRLLPTMLAAAPRGATVLAASSLDEATRAWVDEAVRRADARLHEVPRGALVASLSGFDGAVVAAGTATLECALANVPQVVAGRVGRLTASLLGALLRTPYVALPNVLLRRAAVPELLQDDLEPRRLARALDAVMARPARLREELLPHLVPLDGLTVARRVGDLLGSLRGC